MGMNQGFCCSCLHNFRSPPLVFSSSRSTHEAGRLLYRFGFGDHSSGLPERTNAAAGSYAKRCIAVAAECGVSVIDLWGKMQELPGWEKTYLRDGLHLTREGNRFVFEEVVKQLSQAQIGPETLPDHLPRIEDIDPNDPLKSFEN